MTVVNKEVQGALQTWWGCDYPGCSKQEFVGSEEIRSWYYNPQSHYHYCPVHSTPYRGEEAKQIQCEIGTCGNVFHGEDPNSGQWVKAEGIGWLCPIHALSRKESKIKVSVWTRVSTVEIGNTRVIIEHRNEN